RAIARRASRSSTRGCAGPRASPGSAQPSSPTQRSVACCVRRGVPKLAPVPRLSLLAGAAVAALMLALGLFGPPSGSARTRHAARHVPQGFVGMVVDEPVWPDPFINLPAQLDTMATSGVQSVRSTFDWANMQPYKSWKQVPRAERRAFTSVGGIPTSFVSSD